jgi:hypothetical protein
MFLTTTFKRGTGDLHQKEAWVYRFAIAAFMADHTLAWDTATEAGNSLWSDFGVQAPEAIAATRAGSSGEALRRRWEIGSRGAKPYQRAVDAIG